MSSSAFEEEQQKLSIVLPQIEEQFTKLQAIPRYYGDDFVEQALDHQRQSDLRKLEIARSEPYFGRLDFQETTSNHPISLYIGKVGVSDAQHTHLIVIDWRAPVSSMFYRFTGQEEVVSYESPEGEIKGTIHLKRNIAIRKKILQRVVDSYVPGEMNIGAADEFLLHRLGENKDNKLRDIVSTIQVEQDQIIRAELDKVLIIQGVPGSGKTTVALHRLAYLLYEYQKSLSPERMIIFAPNKMFLDYISSVLPELGVDHIQQTTFLEWALEVLREQEIVLSSANISDLPSDLQNVIHYKGSMQFYSLLQSTLERYEETMIPKKSFPLWERAEISEEELQTWYKEEYRHYPLAKRKERILTRIKRWIETEHKEIREMDSQGQLKKKALTRLRSYAKSWSEPSLLALYQQLLISAVPAIESEKSLLTISIAKLKRKEVELEDIAPLLLIHNHIYGAGNHISFEHVVIDEAQDFSPFQVMILKRFASNSSFTILGDLLQNIYHRGIARWNEFKELFEVDRVQYHQLDISYRSTEEIIHFANAIVAPYSEGISLAKPIYRSGNSVKVMKNEGLEKVAEVIQELLPRATTIAVITKTEEGAQDVHAFLHSDGIQTHLVNSSQLEYLGGITVTSISLVKGMEFDAVLLLDVDEMNYPVTELNAKLLYVGCTRALHHLYLFHCADLSPLIQHSDHKESR